MKMLQKDTESFLSNLLEGKIVRFVFIFCPLLVLAHWLASFQSGAD